MQSEKRKRRVDRPFRAGRLGGFAHKLLGQIRQELAPKLRELSRMLAHAAPKLREARFGIAGIKTFCERKYFSAHNFSNFFCHIFHLLL